VPFTLGDESHTLFFQQVDGKPVLMIASAKGRRASEFVADPRVSEGVDPSKLTKTKSGIQQAQAAADEEADVIKKRPGNRQQVTAADRKVAGAEVLLARELADMKPQDAAAVKAAVQSELNQMGPVADSDIEKAFGRWTKTFGLTNLSVQTVRDDFWAVNSGTRRVARFDIPGTRANPFDLDWPKRASIKYPSLFFGGRVNRFVSQKAFERIFDRGGELPKGTPVREYKPHEPRRLPGGARIGLDPAFRVIAGRTIVGPASKATSPGGSTFNKEVEDYGFRPDNEGLDGDHVHEVQFSGPDDLDNMWPLDSLENQTAGPTLAGRRVTVPGSTRSVKVAELKEKTTQTRQYFFLIVHTK
jgi:hypothetical protein